MLGWPPVRVLCCGCRHTPQAARRNTKSAHRFTRRVNNAPSGVPRGTQIHPPGHPEGRKSTLRVPQRVTNPPSESPGGSKINPPSHPEGRRSTHRRRRCPISCALGSIFVFKMAPRSDPKTKKNTDSTKKLKPCKEHYYLLWFRDVALPQTGRFSTQNPLQKRSPA